MEIVQVPLGLAIISLVWAFLVVVVTLFLGLAAAVGSSLTSREKSFLRNLWTLGGYSAWMLLKRAKANKGWGSPWELNDDTYRFNKIINQYERYHGSEWYHAEHVQGKPLEIRFTKYDGTGWHYFNPYEYFEYPHVPTKEEIALFEIEKGSNFNRIANRVAEIVLGERS